MQKIGFAEALDSIVAADPRYHREAYIFLRDALDYTTKQQKKSKGAAVRHVAGPELLEGVRVYALKEFGPMVMTVFSHWGIDDYKAVYDFHDAFVKPFQTSPANPPNDVASVASAPKNT
jgi:hypothetical protein